MPSSAAVSELLARIAAARDTAPAPAPGFAAQDLGEPAALLELDEPCLRSALEQAIGAPPTIAALCTAVASFAGWPAAPATLFPDLAAAHAALLHAARALRPDCSDVLIVGATAFASAAPPGCRLPHGAFATAEHTLLAHAEHVALLVVEPWLPDPGTANELRSLLAAARSCGVMIAIDETATACRAAATTATAALQLLADHVLLGPSLACGLPFAAIVGALPAHHEAPLSDAALAAVAATLGTATTRATHVELARLGDQLRTAVERAAAREQLQIAWTGPASMPALQFPEQEGAPAALIEEHFALELAALGWQLRGPLLFPAGLRRADPARVAAAFDRALARIRIKFVEYNSYLSGGVPYPWSGGDATLRARGVGIYRYPRQGAVRVAPVPDGPGMRIDFAAGPLGGITSSGFFVPTMFAGDVEVAAHYVLRRWSAGPDSACLGLFLQNAPSSARYYAQVMSTADRPMERTVAAGLAGHVYERHAAPADRGWLRLQRRGGTMTACWRADTSAPWTTLGECPATADPIFIGAKIWSKVACDGLVADIVELHVLGEVAAVQEPLLGPVADPRG